MVEFFSVDNLLMLCSCVVAIIAFVVTLFRTGSIKKSLKEFDSILSKYLTVDSKERKNKALTFSEYVDDYVLGRDDNLEKLPTPKNIQKQIDSYVDTCLQRSLERYMPDNVIDSDEVVDYTSACNDLASFADVLDTAEHYREQFGLSDTLSVSDVYEELGKRAAELKNKLNMESCNNGNGETPQNKQAS